MNAIVHKNKISKDTIINHSHCYSSRTNTKTTILETILENATLATVADTAATGHFFPNEHNDENKHKEIEVVCANNQTMISKATTVLDIPELSQKAKTAYKFNEMKQPLLSIPLLADDGCKIKLTKDNIVVTKNDKIILKGIRDKVSTLWMIPIKHNKRVNLLAQSLPSVPTVHAANSAYHQPTIAKLMAYLNATIGSLPVKTLCTAIDNDWLTSFPGLTSKAIKKHLPKSISTTMGHMHMIRKGIRSTTTPTINEIMNEELAPEPQLDPPRHITNRQHYVGVETIAFEELKGIIATDLPGRFPTTSGQGNAYVLVMYDFDSNSINAVGIKNRKKESLIKGYNEMYEDLRKAGINPVLHRLDNETSHDLIAEIGRKKLDYQIASPGDHRLNHAERAIQTFKNHFIAILFGTDSNFPAKQWDRLIKQAVMTLNMCRASRINPKLSAYQQVWGNFDFNKTPLAPPGCKVVVHERPMERGAWACHGVVGYYIGPAMKHYRNYNSYIPETHGIRTTNTIEFFPEKVDMPTTSTTDRLARATEDLTEILQTEHPATPFLQQGTIVNDAIKQLQKIFTPPNREETAMAAPSPRVLETAVAAPRVDENNNNNNNNNGNQSPRVVTTTTALDRLRNRLATKSARNNDRSRQIRTKSVRKLATVTEEILPHTVGTTIRKIFKKGTLNGKITSYDSEREYYMVEYEDGDSEELRHKSVGRYIVTADTQIDQLQRLTRARLQAKTAKQMIRTMEKHHLYAVFDEVTGKMLEYRHLMKHPDPKIREQWQKSSANEFGRTMQGVGKNRPEGEQIKGTDTMHLIKKCNIPKGKKITYARFVSEIRLQKAEIHRTRLTAGGNQLEYEGKTSTETAGMETIKIHVNSTISRARKGARYLCIDIGNMYLNTKLLAPEYMRIHIDLIPEEIRKEYNTDEFIDENGYVYMEVTGAIYGLSQSGYLANQDLIKNLGKHGYHPVKRTPGLWKHETRKTTFTLVVDDFGVQYFSKEDANHLIDAIKESYPVKVDWTGSKYVGIDLDWNYEKEEVKLSMKGYVTKALKEYQHAPPTKPFDAPTKYHKPEFGQKVQYERIDQSQPLSPKQIKTIQEVCGKFLYTSRAIDNTMQHALNELCIAATKGTQETQEALEYFLNYCATHPEAEIIYRASEMILTIDSDAAYQVAPKSRSRASGYHYLGNLDGKLFNGAVFILAKIIKSVMQSAAEAECGGLYMNAKEAVPMRITLEELNHPQPATPMRTDNSTANGIMNKTVKQKQSKSMDMRFYWLQDRVEQGQFRVFWAPGKINLADYQSKVQPTSVHRAVRPIYLYIEGKSPSTLQGCDKILEALSAGNATKRAPLLTSTLKTTAPNGSYNQASHQPLQLIHLVRNIAYPQ
jgi:hypothetical protein